MSYENTNNVSAAEDIEKMVLEIQEGMLEIQKGMKSHLEQTSEEDTRALLNHLCDIRNLVKRTPAVNSITPSPSRPQQQSSTMRDANNACSKEENKKSPIKKIFRKALSRRTATTTF
jgi:hypothetical protein